MGDLITPCSSCDPIHLPVDRIEALLTVALRLTVERGFGGALRQPLNSRSWSLPLLATPFGVLRASFYRSQEVISGDTTVRGR
jgi:hypothetical protein